MQQMVARQVDLGTYAGQSFVTGHDKGGLVAIAQIEKSARPRVSWRARKLKITKVPTSKIEDRQSGGIVHRQYFR